MLSGAQLAGTGRIVEHHQFDMAADKIVQGRGRTLVGDVGQAHPRLAGEALHGQMMRRADARRGVVDRSWLGPGTLDEVAGRGRGGVLLDHEEEREAGHQPDRAEVAVGVVGQLLEQSRVEDEGAVVGGEDGLAVRLGLGGGSRADVRGAARAVLDHHRLAQLGRHGLAQDARQRVGAAAGGVGDDPVDRAFRVGGETPPGAAGHGGKARGQSRTPRDVEVVHGVSPAIGQGRAGDQRTDAQHGSYCDDATSKLQDLALLQCRGSPPWSAWPDPSPLRASSGAYAAGISVTSMPAFIRHVTRCACRRRRSCPRIDRSRGPIPLVGAFTITALFSPYRPFLTLSVLRRTLVHRGCRFRNLDITRHRVDWPAWPGRTVRAPGRRHGSGEQWDRNRDRCPSAGR